MWRRCKCVIGVCGEMVKKTVLEEFVKKRGYEYVKRKRNRKWKGISEASKKTGLSRPTIYSILEEYPEPPSKTQPIYVEEFRDSEGCKEFIAKYGNRGNYKTQLNLVRRAFVILNKKDPISWTKKDYQIIWNHNKFVHPDLNAIPEATATAFHNLMRVTDKTEFLLQFKGKKFPKGKKKEWFLEEDEIIGIASKLQCNATLLLLGLGTVKGGRFSALVQGTPNNINMKDSVMLDYEPKRKQYLTRYVSRPIMKLLQDYIKDYKIKPKEKLFPHSYDYYNTNLSEAGEKAGIKKTVSTHIMKHTFVTQGSRHGVSAEIISEQTGTELRTLTAHYRAKNPKKARHELLGEQTDVVPFYEWIRGLEPYFRENYERIKKQDGVTRKMEKPLSITH